MRRSTIPAAVSMCLAVLLTVGFFGAATAAATTPSGYAIPTGFHAQSLTWVSPQHGWMLGVAPCGQTMCTTVVGTTDGGGTWNTLGAFKAPVTSDDKTGVSEVEFADDLHGWAFGPALWATRDAGATWKKQTPPGGGQRVLALAGNSDAVYAVVSPCRLNHLCGDPATLWRTTAGGGTWTQVSVTLPVATSAVLAVQGVVAYVIAPTFSFDGVLDATVDGQAWSSRPNPCHAAKDETLWDVAPISDTKVALLCVGNPGFSMAEKRILRSNDTGQTSRSAGTTPMNGITSQLAAAPNGTLVVSSYSDGSWIYQNASGRTWTTPVSLADFGMGWNDVVFTTNQVGFVIHGPWAFCCGGGPGELWGTHDGGVTWGPV